MNYIKLFIILLILITIFNILCKCLHYNLETFIDKNNQIEYNNVVSTLYLKDMKKRNIKNNRYYFIDFINDFNESYLYELEKYNDTKYDIEKEFLLNNNLDSLRNYIKLSNNIKFTNRYILNNELYFLEKGQFLIQINGYLQFKSYPSFNKLYLSVALCIELNGKIIYESWNNSDISGRCNFNLYHIYNSDLVNSIKIGIKYDDNTSNFISNSNDLDKDKYKYIDNNDCDNISITIINLSNLKSNINNLNDKYNYLNKKLDDYIKK